MSLRSVKGAVVLLLLSCTQPQLVAPNPAPPAVATFVAASFDLTWTAALDHLATAGLQTASVDRPSGVIITGEALVDAAEALEYADCGARLWSASGGEQRERYPASSATYEIVVTRDGVSASLLLVTATWGGGDAGSPFACETTRVWEDEAQEAIRLAAEVNR